MRRHLDLLEQPSLGILEIDMRNSISATCERRGAAVVHAKESGFLAAFIHAADEVEEVSFSAAKRIVVLVAIQDAHGFRPIEKCEKEIGRQTLEYSAGDCRKRRRRLPPLAESPSETFCGRGSNEAS